MRLLGPRTQGVLAALLVGMEGCNCDTAGQPDAGPAPAYAIVVTQSPPGPTNNNPASWGGVLQYVLSSDGGALQPLPGIDAGLVHDPSSVLYLPGRGELLVGNRHGNNAADGVPGSISRFRYSPARRDFTLEGEVMGQGLVGVHQLASSAASGELFAATYGSGVSRLLVLDGGFVAHGTLGSGPVRGVLPSADGQRLYLTDGTTGLIQRLWLDGGAALPPVAVPGALGLHYFALHGGTVYVAGLSSGRVYRLREEEEGGLTVIDSFPASSPVSVAVDPTGLRLYVAGHDTADVLETFVLDGGTWSLSSRVATGYSLGGIELLP